MDSYVNHERQVKIIDLLADDYSIQQIADLLGISEKCVRKNKEYFFKQYGVKSVIAAHRVCIRRGFMKD